MDELLGQGQVARLAGVLEHDRGGGLGYGALAGLGLIAVHRDAGQLEAVGLGLGDGVGDPGGQARRGHALAANEVELGHTALEGHLVEGAADGVVRQGDREVERAMEWNDSAHEMAAKGFRR